MAPKRGRIMEDHAKRDFIALIFEGYLKRKAEKRLYQRDSEIPQMIIALYYHTVQNPYFNIIYNNFKRNYLYNESRIDEDLSDEERAGLSRVYDYIKSYDFSKQKFDIFVEALKIHELLYSACPEPSFGGSLRTSSALLMNSEVEVPPAEEARAYFQSYIGKVLPKVDLDNPISIFDYINACIYVTTELTKAQPFSDGNKRTFRSLLNLMFKQYNLPPIYVKTRERKEYKDALMKAFKNRDYVDLQQFYYYKICDAIYDLDILPDLKGQENAKGDQKVKKADFPN